jgi:hypothetical protein
MLISTKQVQTMMEQLVGVPRTNTSSAVSIERRTHSAFGFDAKTVAITWNMLHTKNLIEKKAKLKYLLFTIAFFKSYNTYDQLCQRFFVSYPTVSEWIWYFAFHIAQLDIVSTTKDN